MTFQNHWSIMWLRGGKIPQALRVETSWVVPVDLPPADIVFQCCSGSRNPGLYMSPEELIAERDSTHVGKSGEWGFAVDGDFEN